MKSEKSQPASAHPFDAYKEQIAAHVREAEAKLGTFQATAKEKGGQVETAAINDLKTAKQNIDRKLQDLKATAAVNVSRAKADINADVESFKAAVNDFGARVKAGSTRK